MKRAKESSLGQLTVRALPTVLAVLLAGSVFVQTVMVALVAADMDELDANLQYLRIPTIVVMVLGIATIQVVLVYVWRLVAMVRKKTVFSPRAFRYVNIVIGAIVAAATLILALAALLASANHRVPEDAVPPGFILLMGGAAVAVLGVALIVFVLRMLLAQAIARDVEATRLRDELGQVI